MKNTSTPTTTSYHFDFATVLLIVSSIYTIPAIYCAFKIVRFYFKSFVPTSTSLNPNLFKAYLRMQNWSLAYVIIDIVLIRVPATSLVATSLCTPWLVPFLVAVQYFTWHTAHLFPVLFCFVRVLILWSPKEHREIHCLGFTHRHVNADVAPPR
uniref:Serpentine receptor class gamma n=1 Tax=Caenorhabditis japonica TaxID=281687 RepID=A0A8R1HRR7_CAEJA